MQKNSFFKKGAEAELTEEIFCGKLVLSKKRIPKSYRAPGLDLLIRKTRTRSEAKILRDVSFAINVPDVIKVDENNAEILMEFIPGKRLKEVIEKKPLLAKEAGKLIRKIHDLGIIHGDLTTSNIIFVDENEIKQNEELLKRVKKKGNLFFIDFGLGFYSKKVEDRATDLVVFKKTFNATHSSLKKGWKLVMEGYNPDKELHTRMEAIEKRARYH
ncbi:MAG: KEOPS complex kinase/ATPase Bud32 [archaeon]|jgi:Kae1-associated kinase Bud32